MAHKGEPPMAERASPRREVLRRIALLLLLCGPLTWLGCAALAGLDVPQLGVELEAGVDSVEKDASSDSYADATDAPNDVADANACCVQE
jgi:hypothetical protein